MGSIISVFYQTADTSEATQNAVLALLRDIGEKETSSIEWGHIEQHINNIPREEKILSILSDDGYNLLQVAIGVNCVELVKWILNYGCDVNQGSCSLPLHIAASYGSREIVELLLKHGACVDLNARMCFPGPHNQNCELKSCKNLEIDVQDKISNGLQSAEYYAISSDRSEILELLLAHKKYSWQPLHQAFPLLHLACEMAAWNCTRLLVAKRSDEINQCYNECYPIHQAAMLDLKFLELLLQCGADVLVKTASQQKTVLHVLLSGQKSAKATLQALKMLLDHGCCEIINEPDTFGNTPLHALIVRYALEESRFGYAQEPSPWNKWDMLHMVRYLLQNGASPSINHQGNSALACVLRHIQDWEFRYELLEVLLENGGNPNSVGRDGSVPLMVCLVPLINKDPLQFLAHNKKVFYLNSVSLLCKYGANPNYSSRSNLTLMHVLVFHASDYVLNIYKEEYLNQVFTFIRKLLIILLKHGLDPNVQFSEEYEQIPQGRPHLHYISERELDQNSQLSEQYEHLKYKLPQTHYMNQHRLDPNIHLSKLYEHVHQTLMDMVS